jgi:hypothetical protein
MSELQFTCPVCIERFNRAAKEIRRQRKKNALYIPYCSLRCGGKNSHAHLRGHKGLRFQSGSAHHQKAIAAAITKNTRYGEEDRPFVEYLRRTRQRSYPFDLDLPFLKELWQQQGGRCAISNLPIELTGVARSKLNLASLDRKDSGKGYIKGNVQFVAYCINLAKNNLTDEDAHSLMRLICKNYLTASRE